MSGDIFCGFGVPVELPAKSDAANVKEQYSDAFHVVKETLTRIGIASRKSKILFQTAHILHKRGFYAILMFKELFALDGKEATITTEDIARRNTIVKLLSDWDLVKVLDMKRIEPQAPLSQLRVLSYLEKRDWVLKPKYQIGRVLQRKET